MEWIYLEDAKPEEKGKYLCCYQGGYICTGNYLGHGLWKMHGKYAKKPYAWMELPKPAKIRMINLMKYASK